MNITNLKAEIEQRIADLDGTESRKDLLTLLAAAEVDSSINISRLQDFIDANDATIDASTSDVELVTQSRSEKRYPFVEEIIKKGGGFVNEYPYDFLTGEKESSNRSIGQSGSTWWVSPTTIGRVEEGKDVVYTGSTYESSEDRTSTRYNKANGEAVISLKRITVESDPVGNEPEYMTWTERALNSNLTSYLSDEHHQAFVFHNKQNGQLITGYGSRGAASPLSAIPQQNICYGKTLETLSTLETPTFASTANYMQLLGTGNSVYAFSRIGLSTWRYSKGSGGQGFTPDSYSFLNAGDDVQYYLSQKWIDANEAGKVGLGIDRSRTHCFGQGHPTKNPDGKLQYLLGTMVLAGDTPETKYEDGGLYYSKPTTGAAPQDNGKLGEMGTIAPTDMETAFTAPSGKSYRLLDVQYGSAPRALIGLFDLDWTHGDDIPLGTTYDLVLVQFNEWSRTWSNHTIKTGVRGALGFKPWTGDSIAGTTGSEGFSSFYMFGSCFYRGKNLNDALPKIYLAHRVGSDMQQHRLSEITLTGDYTTVESERDLTPLLLPNSMVDWNNVTDGVPSYKSGVQGSRNIIYRPDAILGGNKRGLRVDVAQGWSTFNSWSAEGSILMLDEEPGTPVISQINADVTVAVGTVITIGCTATNATGAEMTYQWLYKDAGGSWGPASATTKEFDLTVQASADGRQYRVEVTTDAGMATSSIFTITTS